MIEVVLSLLGFTAIIIATSITWYFRLKIAQLIIDNPNLSNEKVVAICEMGSKDINITTPHSNQ